MPANDRLYDETAPRSIFATTWFRALLVLIVLAVAVAISAPYLLDVTRSPKVATRPTVPPTATTPSPAPTSPSSATATPSPTVPPPTAKSTLSPPAPSPAPTSPAPSAKSTALDKPVPPDRVPLDKSAPSATPPRRPLAGDTTALADKPMPGDKSSKTTSSDSVGADKAVAKSAAADKSTTEKKDARVAAATTESKATARAAKPAAARSTTTASAPRAAAAGAWWVQVGAFRDETSAKKLATKLREQNYTVQQSVRNGGGGASTSAMLDKSAPAASTSNPAGADQYDVFVSGLSPEELNTRLAGKGLNAEPSGAGALLKPSLPLRDAVALSKDLATDGYKVQVRRAGGASAQAPRPAEQRPVATVSGGDTLYRVRVGAFADRATAMTTLKELEGKGYKPFIARGGS